MAAPTPTELEILTKFKENLADLHLDDEEDTQYLLIRFLRARNHSLPKAEDMLRKHLEWRKENEIDTLLKWTPPQIFLDEFQYDVAGFDKEGCPVLVCPAGIWDVKGICDKGLKRDYVKYVDQMFVRLSEAMKESSERKGTPVTQFVAIMLPDEFQAFRQMSSVPAVDTVLETLSRYEANFPETLKSAYVIDAPKVFNLLYNLVKPLMNPVTLGKLNVTTNEKQWKSLLLSAIDEDQLSTRLGGTRCSNVPILNAPRGQYKRRSSKRDEIDGFKEATVAAGQAFRLPLEIDNGYWQVSWTFKTDKNDIGFSLIGDNSEEPLFPYKRIDSDAGRVVCSKPGKYTLIFDNGFSKFRSKVLHYKVDIERQSENLSNGD